MAVFVNYSRNEYPVKLKANEKPGSTTPVSYKKYTTTAKTNENIKYEEISSADDIVKIPERLVVRLVVRGS